MHFALLVLFFAVARVQGASVEDYFTSNTLRENNRQNINSRRPHEKTWGVRIDGGPADADEIAWENGFDNKGLVRRYVAS